MKQVIWFPLLAALSGCIQTEYDLELKPIGKALERKLAIKRSGSEASPEELKRLAKEYRTDPPISAKEQTFKGLFSGRMPSDVGGRGSFTRWESPLGSVAIYVERFRGNDDAAGELKRRQVVADRLVELLTGWLENELREDPQWPAFQRFLQEDLRRDLLNLSIYAWTLGLNEQNEQNPESALRAAQYLVERGYLEIEDLPAIRRAALDANRGDYDRLMALIKQMLVARLREEGRPPPSLEFFATPEKLVGSLRAHLEKTPEYARHAQQWEEELKSNPDAEKPDSLQVAGELLAQLFAGVFQFGGDRLTLALQTGRRALLTNGQWSADTAQLKWSERRLPDRELPPTLAYAVWDEPNASTQKTRFGKVVLTGYKLADYCIWRQGLTDRERREWDDFVGKLRPGPKLSDDLRAFRFHHEAADSEPGQRLAKSAIEAIVAELSE